MIILVPVMFVITLSLTFLFLSHAVQEELSISNVIARDFAMVHEWRSDRVERQNILDGEFDDTPGYPFVPFHDYYTEVHETEDYIAVVTWVDDHDGSESTPHENATDLLFNIESQLKRGSYSGNFKSYGDNSGGKIAAFELVGMDRQPEDGVPIIAKIFTKE